jgi:hypothetical protein
VRTVCAIVSQGKGQEGHPTVCVEGQRVGCLRLCTGRLVPPLPAAHLFCVAASTASLSHTPPPNTHTHSTYLDAMCKAVSLEKVKVSNACY